jgi:hypothetical protein
MWQVVSDIVVLPVIAVVPAISCSQLVNKTAHRICVVRGARVKLLFALTAIATVASVSAALGSEAAPGSSRYSSVTLGAGEIVGDPWSASIRREDGAAQAKPVAELQPCLSISSKRFNGGEGGETCTFRSRLTPESGALWTTTSEPNQAETETAMTAVAMVFAPRAAAVKATLVGGKVETIGLRRLTSQQARAAGLGRLRYTAFATAGTWCVTRLESFDRAGHRLWRSHNLLEKSCPAES